MGRKHRKPTAKQQRREERRTGGDLAAAGMLVLMLTIANEPVVTTALSGAMPSTGFRIGDVPMVDGVLSKIPDRREPPAKQEPARKGPPAKAKR